ncbi:membrane protein insertase YidC [Parasphingorhabdus sp. DH2-15]|uniref:membrane protein insertase YidC n=1 Tax=Parasphingorhabdus sp. DH2-15 TaxID=3444112 RepID=UPI003F684943
MENQRNIILAVVLTALVLFGSQYIIDTLYPQPVLTEEQIAAAAKDKAADANASAADGGQDVLAATGDVADAPASNVNIDSVLNQGQRVKIKNPLVEGTINLVGARLDDLVLTDHRETVAKDSPAVRLFGPEGTLEQHYAQFGWLGQIERPKSDTLWSADSDTLAPGKPVKLSWSNSTGQLFTITFSIDENYLITAEQKLSNNGEAPVQIEPLAFISRNSTTADEGTWILRTGPLGVFDDAANFDWGYDDVAEAPGKKADPEGQVSWLGFSDIYWLSTLIADDKAKVSGSFVNPRKDIYRTDLNYDAQIIAPGKALTITNKLYAGAKNTELLDYYTDEQGITLLDRAIDWGWFYWFEKPIFYLLKWLFDNIGNFGVAIIVLVLIIRGLMFPIAQKQFASMAAMRAIQPKMKKIQDRYKDDKQKMQQEVMALYKKEKVNPLAGCLPIFLQIPIFFALYKVLLLSIEMRHQPFALWITDLSAPDPLTPVNLFGLLPFEPVSFLAIGVLPIIVGVTMWLQFKLNPAPADPVQQQVFSIMPWMLMFVMAPFAAGLQLYWATSNLLTIAQQKLLYSRHPQLKEQMRKDAEEKAKEKERAKAEKQAKVGKE